MISRNKSQPILVPFAAVALSAVFERVINVLITPLLAKGLSKTDFGAITLSYAVSAILLLFVLNGLNSALFRERSLWDDRYDFRFLENKAIILSLSCFVLVCILGALNLLLDSSNAALGIDSFLFFTVLVSTCSGFLFQLKISVYASENRYLYLLAVSLLRFSVIALLFWFFHEDFLIFGRQFGEFAFNLICICMFAISFKLSRAKHTPEIHTKTVKRDLKDLIVYGWTIQVSQLAFWVIASSDRLIIGSLLGKIEVAEYTIATYLLIFSFLIGSFATAFSSSYNRMFSSKENYDHVVSIVILVGSGCFLAAGIVVSIFSKQIVLLISSEDYLNVSSFLVMSVYMLYSYFLYICVSRGLHALGKGKLILVASGTAAGINIILNVFFVELYGVVFALYSSIISYLFAGILIVYFSYKNEISQRKTIASGALCLMCATVLLSYV